MNKLPANSDKSWFFYTILFIVIDYGRPQDIFPIGFLRPAMIVSLVLIFYIIINGYDNKYSHKQIKYTIFFVILLACHIPFSVNNYFSYITTKKVFLYLPFMISVVATVNTIERFKKIIFVLICLMIYVSGYCLTHGGVGSGNYFADENDISLYINMYLPFCFFLFFYEKKLSLKVFYMVGLIVGLSGLIISFSRGGFVGLLVVGAVIWLVNPKKIRSLIIIILVSTVFYVTAGDQYLNEMRTITDTDDGTAGARIESWKAGWRMFLDHPLGVGGGNFMVRFPDYQSDYFQRGMWGRAAHSLWFTLIPELGIPGIVIYFSLLFANMKDLLFLWRLKLIEDPDFRYLYFFSLAMIASLAGFFATGTFISVLYYAHYWYLVPLIVVAVNIAKKMKVNESEKLVSQLSNH